MVTLTAVVDLIFVDIDAVSAGVPDDVEITFMRGPRLIGDELGDTATVRRRTTAVLRCSRSALS